MVMGSWEGKAWDYFSQSLKSMDVVNWIQWHGVESGSKKVEVKKEKQKKINH